jgi:hypothetical protein
VIYPPVGTVIRIVCDQFSHLVVEFVAHRPARRTASVADLLPDGGTVGEMQLDDRRLDRRRRVLPKPDPGAQRLHRRIGDAGILVLRQPGGAEQGWIPAFTWRRPG